MIKQIVFDFGGVLVEYDFFRFFRSLLPGDGETRWFMEHVFTDEANAELDLGLVPPSRLIARLGRMWPEYAGVLEAFDRRYTDVFTAEPAGMRQLMGELKAGGYRLLGLSNWSEKVVDVMAKFSIFELLDDMLISKDVHLLKPHADIYRAFFQRMGVRPGECVFIDDKPENILGARRCGMYGLVFSDVDRLRRELRPLLSGYSFRPATAADEPVAWQLVHDAAADMERRGRCQWSEAYPDRRQVADDIADGRAHLLEVDGRAVGYVALSDQPEPAYGRLDGAWLTDGRYATIHRMAVATDSRGCGFGRLLITEAEMWAHRRGLPSLRTDTNHDNAEMLALTTGYGFERTGLCQYTIGGQPAERIAMEKRL